MILTLSVITSTVSRPNNYSGIFNLVSASGQSMCINCPDNIRALVVSFGSDSAIIFQQFHSSWPGITYFFYLFGPPFSANCYTSVATGGSVSVQSGSDPVLSLKELVSEFKN